MSSRSCLFSERSSPLKSMPFISSLVFDQLVPFHEVSKIISKALTIIANSSKFFEINSYILSYGSFSPTFTHIYFQIYRCSQFLSPYECPCPNSTTWQTLGRAKTNDQLTSCLKHRDERLQIKSKEIKCKMEMWKRNSLLGSQLFSTGWEPRRNVLLTYYKLTSFVSDFPPFSIFYLLAVFSQVL